MNIIKRYLKPHAGFLAFTLFIKTIATISELIIPYILSHIIDVIIPKVETLSPGESSDKILFEIIFWGGMMIVCAAMALLFNVIANRRSVKTARDATEKIRHDLFNASLHLSCRNADRVTIPSLESRLTSDTYNLHHFIGMMQRIGVRAPLLLLGGVLITLMHDAYLASVMIAIIPLLAIFIYFYSKKTIPLYAQVQKNVDGMVRVVREDSQGIRVIKALSKKDYEQKRFDNANIELVKIEKKVGYITALSNPIMQIVLNLGLVCVVLLGAYRVNADLTQPGKIIAFMQYFTLISTSMMVLSRIFMAASKGIASANRIGEVIDMANEISACSTAEYPDASDDFHIAFEKVSFGYHKDKPILRDISFKLKKGQTLGIIGATGSGKTTLISLLMRFYDVTDGAVRINGRDVRTIETDELHSMFGVALQNDFIFNGTVKENIDFGRNLSFNEIKNAARRAQALGFIEEFPEGFEHEVTSKGTNISGGQKQRLLISRALAGSPEILILDDSSSALDYKTDLNLRRAIAEQDGDTTVIIVAQRISSVMNSDLIIVLDDGEINGIGTHGQLLESCEIYKEISDSQMGGAFLE